MVLLSLGRATELPEGDFFKIQTLKSHPLPTESEFWGVESKNFFP